MEVSMQTARCHATEPLPPGFLTGGLECLAFLVGEWRHPECTATHREWGIPLPPPVPP